MLNIKGNKIHLTRGDNMEIVISLTDENGDDITPSGEDKVIFRLKKNSSSQIVLIEKEVDISTMTLELEEADTKDLKFGKYFYEIEYVTSDSKHYTAIENEEFEIGVELEIHTEDP